LNFTVVVVLAIMIPMEWRENAAARYCLRECLSFILHAGVVVAEGGEYEEVNNGSQDVSTFVIKRVQQLAAQVPTPWIHLL
jgi:hypothetical protein